MAFNLGSQEETTILDLANIISKLTGSDIQFGKKNYGDSARRLPDLESNKLLEWKAETTLIQGLNQLL